MEIVRLGDLSPEPWKNGHGTSWVIAMDEDEPPAWRLSLALIERNAPFSSYPGFDRTIVAVAGGDVALDVAGERTPLERFGAFRFDGGASTACELDGPPARDLNVMTLRSTYVHDVEVVRTPQRFLLDDDELAFCYVAKGRVSMNGQSLEEGDTAFFEAGEDTADVRPGATACACVVRITRID